MFLKRFISQNERRIFRQAHYLMGTFWEIEIADNGREKSKVVLRKAFDEIKRLEGLLSRYRKESEISKLNREAFSSAIAVSEETFEVISMAVEYSRVEGGAFDITIAPLVSFWGKAKKAVPASDDLAEVLALVGYDNLVLDPVNRTVNFRKEGMELDLGGLAKGYAMDKAINILKENGIEKAMINAGGEIYILDSGPVGIKNPLEPDQIIATIEIESQAIATTANYERFSLISGKRFGHVISPLTGYPADGLLSVSVIAKDCTRADILSTALFVRGKDDKLPFCEGVVAIEEKDGKPRVNFSDELAARIKLM